MWLSSSQQRKPFKTSMLLNLAGKKVTVPSVTVPFCLALFVTKRKNTKVM
jgi:hypothetical protein